MILTLTRIFIKFFFHKCQTRLNFNCWSCDQIKAQKLRLLHRLRQVFLLNYQNMHYKLDKAPDNSWSRKLVGSKGSDKFFFHLSLLSSDRKRLGAQKSRLALIFSSPNQEKTSPADLEAGSLIIPYLLFCLFELAAII